jgi:hypothetical protein
MPYGRGNVLQHTIRASKDFDQLVKHMVSPTGSGIRAVVLDNIKGAISGQDIESLMTSVTITGHQMYAGFGATPNYFTWFANGNGLRMSDDIAKRLMPIMINRAKYDPSWDAKVRSIDWLAVLSGVATVLDRPSTRLAKYSRWGLWEAEVLSKCTDDPNGLIQLIYGRQTNLSETDEMAKDLIEAIEGWADEAIIGDDRPEEVVLSGQEIAGVFRVLTGHNWNPRSVARKLRELNWLGGRIKTHPNTALRRYVFTLYKRESIRLDEFRELS